MENPNRVASKGPDQRLGRWREQGQRARGTERERDRDGEAEGERERQTDREGERDTDTDAQRDTEPPFPPRRLAEKRFVARWDGIPPS